MDRACSANVENTSGKVRTKQTSRKTKDFGERVKLKYILRVKAGGDVDWIGLAQDRNK
jgi:hypothetical protein